MSQIEVTEFQKEGYKPLVEYEGWKVAVLRFCDDLLPENVRTMQKHLFTDEVFVLLSGNFVLYEAGDGELPGIVEAVNLEPYKLYNVKKGVWHNHTMTPDGTVLIVENQETQDTEDNSPIRPLNEEQKAKLCRLCKELGY